MTRSLAFAGSITPARPALDLDPRSATAAQVALVLADCRTDGQYNDDADAAVIAHVQATIDPLEVHGDDKLAQAYRAVLTAP